MEDFRAKLSGWPHRQGLSRSVELQGSFVGGIGSGMVP